MELGPDLREGAAQHSALSTQRSQSAEIREMFAEISGRYDFLNHLLSFNLDRLWRRALVKEGLTANPRRILDLATGTGDLAALFRKRLPQAGVVGADFCLPMLELARRKANKAKRAAPGRLSWTAADALKLPFRDASFDLVTIAFGLRNFADPALALSEIRRVAAPAGKLLVLEFSMELSPWLAALYRPYFRHVLPRLGRLVSGSDAYAYLNRSVEALPAPAEVAGWMQEGGFPSIRTCPLSGGVVVLYIAKSD